MRKRVTELLNCLDATRTRLLATVRGVNPAVAEIQPADGAWSAAQIVAHLAIVEASVVRLVERSVAWARENGVGPESPDDSVLGNLESSTFATSRQKIQAPEAMAPPTDAKMEIVLKSLETSRVALRKALVEGDGLDLSAVKRPHRILGELNVYEWVLFVAHHEQRHTRQIDETIKAVCADAVQTVPIV